MGFHECEDLSQDLCINLFLCYLSSIFSSNKCCRFGILLVTRSSSADFPDYCFVLICSFMY